MATGAGVVTYSGERSGYGKMVEINHGNGLSTRYGHAKELLVEPGEIVRTGDVVGKVGAPAAPRARMCTTKCSKTALK